MTFAYRSIYFYPCFLWSVTPCVSLQGAETRLRLWSLRSALSLWVFTNSPFYRSWVHISCLSPRTKMYRLAYCRRKKGKADLLFSLIDSSVWLGFLFCLICKWMGFIISSIALSCLAASLPLESQSRLAPQHLAASHLALLQTAVASCASLPQPIPQVENLVLTSFSSQKNQLLKNTLIKSVYL